MSIRDRASSQQVLAVALALVMLLSVGGMVFAGGVGAQTGSTADGLVAAEEPVTSELGIASDDGEVLLTGTSDDLTGANPNVDVDADGSITVDPQNSVDADQFSGVTVTPNRINVSGDNLATGLDSAVDDVVVEGDATPVVVIELAPQSNFSQTDGVAGTHDFIVIGQENQLPGNITNGAATTNITAYAVNNDNFTDSSELTSTTGTFGDAIGALVGTSESDLQNENVDDFRIGAGTFGDTGPVNVNALQISDDAVEGETIHSELITLDDGDNERYFNSVTNASSAAADGDTITVDDGTYTDLEADPVVLSNNELTVSGAGEAGTNLDTNLNVTGNNVTVEDFDIDVGDSGSDGIIDVNAENTTIQRLTVDQQGPGETGINVTSGANSAVTTVADVTVNSADENNVAQGDTGLALDTNAGEEVSVTNSTFVGHQTQIDGNDNVDEGALLTANGFADADAQSAVARNADGDVVGNAIFGSINAADAENPVDGSIDVSQGTYTHTDAVNITTDNVSVTETDGPATINNDLEISGSAGDVTVTGFDVDVASTTVATSLDSLTFDSTTAASFDVGATAGAVTNATFVSTGDDTTGTYNVTAADTVDVDGAVGGAFDLEGTSAVDVSGADGDSFALDSTGDVTVSETASDGAVDIGLDVQPADVTITDGEASNYNIADVSGDVEVTGAMVTAGGISVPDTAENVSVENADITLDTGGDIGVDITATGEADEVISVTNTSVDGANTTGTGIEVTEVNSGVTAEYTIDDNTLTNFGDGIGVNITEQASTGREAIISTSGNVIAGGSQFVGIRANLSAAEDVAIVDNEIVGADVSGGENSVGIKFIEAPDFGGGFLGGGDGAAFTNNTITGHARLIEDRSSGAEPPIRSDGYTSIINDLDNEFGTLVIGPNGDYEATYGDDLDINDNGGVVYLPGSISEAMSLVDTNPNVDSADLQVYETDVTVSSAISSTPDRYDDEPVVFPDADDITVSGESEDVIAETTFDIAGGDERNNHDIRSLTINSGGDAITVDTTKAQSEFTNLTVTADGSGVVTTLSGDDVNVIEVRDSTFDVGANGIDFSGTTDDRDGFVIDNVEVDGAGIGAGDTGLDLSGVEKPGKAGLPVNLTVTGTDVANFSTQVDVGTELPVDAEDFLNDVTTSSVTVENNDFSHAILVYESDESTLADDNLYGSVVAADNAATPTENEVIELRHTADSAGTPTVYNHGDTDVDITTEDVTVSGPVTADGSSDVRDNEVVIKDSVLATADDVTLEGLAVVAPDSRDGVLTAGYGTNDDSGATDAVVVGAEAGNDLTVESVSITSTIDPAVAEDSDSPMPVGIGVAAGDSVLDVYDTYVGAHEAGETTGSAVVAQEDVDLTVDNSEFRDGETVIDTDGGNDIISEAYGVLAGDGTTPEITDTVIDGFDEDGVNTIDDSLSLTGGEVTDNNQRSDAANSGVGGVVTNADIGAPAEEYSISGTDIENNTGPGVDLTGVGLTMDAATVSGNAGDGVSVDGDDVTISDDTTIESNDATGANLTVANATVEDSTVSANENGLAVDADNDVTVDNNTVSSHDGSAVDVAATTASVTDNTVTDNGQGTVLDLSDGANSTVTLNTLANNTQGLVIANGADELTVTGNTFTSTDTDIQNNDDSTLDGTLNYFGTSQGPASDAAAGVTDNVVYDPFLTTDQTDTSVAEIESTTGFAHDVVVPEDQGFASVGFPADPGDTTIQDVFDVDDIAGNVYALDRDTGNFATVEPGDQIRAFDAFVVENKGDDARVVSIEYDNDRTFSDPIVNTYEFQEGINFVAPQQAGQVDEVLFPGGDTDAVIQPFAAGENLYGDEGADQVRDQFVTPDSAEEVSTNFRSGAGDATVHPHVGYIVIVNEESNEGLEVTEQIPVPDSPTADNIADRTNADANTITNADTGDTYTDIQVALDEAQDGDTLRLGAGTYESAADPALVREDDITITGAGATSVIDSNVTVDGDNVEFRDLTIVGEFTVNGNNVRSQDVDIQANSPGDVTLNGNGASLTDTSIEESLAVNGENARVSNSNVGGTLSINANNTEVTGTTRGATTVGANVDTGTLDLGQEVAFDLSEIDGDSFENGTTDNERNVTLTVEEDLAANDDYTVRMTVTGPDGSEVDLVNDDTVTVSDVSIGDFQLDSQPVKDGNEFYIAEDGNVETRSGSNLNSLSEVGSEGIEGSITFNVDSNAVTGDYDLEMTVVQYDGQEVVEVNETGEATVTIT